MTQQEDNKRLVQRFYEEVWNNNKLEVIDELFAPDYVVKELPRWRKSGAEGLKEFIADNHRIFPDIQITILWIIAEDGKVAVCFRGAATHEGDLDGPVGLVPATGRKIQWDGTCFFRINDGKIIETKAIVDNMGLMQQLGAVPTPTT